MKIMAFFDSLGRDLRYALRGLARRPAFTFAAVITLALGIGATTAIFSVLDGVVLKPLSYPHPEQLVSVEISPLALDPSLRGIAPEDYFIFQDQSRTFQEIGIYAETDTESIREPFWQHFDTNERRQRKQCDDCWLYGLGLAIQNNTCPRAWADSRQLWGR